MSRPRPRPNISLTTLYSGITACGQACQDALARALTGDPEKLARLSRAVIALTALEIDVFSAHYDVLRTQGERERRSAQGAEFNKEIVSVVEHTASGSRKVRAQAADASQAARGMLGKTSEVAAAAEQSAVAMREAAQTAAGLIMAIEEARNEVEVAAGVAVRAGDQASEAVAGQPGAFRPCRGDRIDPRPDPRHRRADQFARAQRDHRGGARGRRRPRLRGRRAGGEEPRQRRPPAPPTTSPPRSPRSSPPPSRPSPPTIRSQATVEEVQVSADRIRKAMEMQAQTVTMITAAVDETALAADSMSSTIAAIRTDTENVASEIDEVEKSFGEVDEQMAKFKATAGKFVQSFAA